MLGSKCLRCLKGKKGCKYTVEELGELGAAEIELQGKKSLIALLKQVLSLPIQLLQKHKDTDLSPEAIKHPLLF